LIESWSRFRIQEMNWAVLQRALRVREAHGFSFWDSAVVAAALELGCERLYTEDLKHGQVVMGIEIVNPFR
jgi:predicted nucleic acid-binding protein